MDPAGSCVSYIYACDANRDAPGTSTDEAVCFLTNRGYGNAIINFKPNDLDNQWKRRILYQSNNAINCNAVEKEFQKKYHYLPQGTRRLWKRAGAGGVGNKHLLQGKWTSAWYGHQLTNKYILIPLNSILTQHHTLQKNPYSHLHHHIITIRMNADNKTYGQEDS